MPFILSSLAKRGVIAFKGTKNITTCNIGGLDPNFYIHTYIRFEPVFLKFYIGCFANWLAIKTGSDFRQWYTKGSIQGHTLTRSMDRCLEDESKTQSFLLLINFFFDELKKKDFRNKSLWEVKVDGCAKEIKVTCSLKKNRLWLKEQ